MTVQITQLVNNSPTDLFRRVDLSCALALQPIVYSYVHRQPLVTAIGLYHFEEAVTEIG